MCSDVMNESNKKHPEATGRKRRRRWRRRTSVGTTEGGKDTNNQ